MGKVTDTKPTPEKPSYTRSFKLTIGNLYDVGEKLGSGNFGEVRKVKHKTQRKDFAAKLEPLDARIPQLHLEHRFYKLLENEDGSRVIGIPKAHFLGECGGCQKCESGGKCGSPGGPDHKKFTALVVDLLGPNIEDLFDHRHRKFSLKTVNLIAIQLLDRLQYVHKCRIVYRDIKPENFVIGYRRDTSHILHIIDFGLAKEYIDAVTKKHIPFRDRKSLTGTARYMSLNTHLKYEQSRRDDLEALGFMLLYFVKGKLPWQGLAIDDIKARYQKIGEIKKQTPINKLCEQLPHEYEDYMTYVRQLKFDADPDYDYLKNLFVRLCNNKEQAIDWVFDWTGVVTPIPSPSSPACLNMSLSDIGKHTVLPSMRNIYESPAPPNVMQPSSKAQNSNSAKEKKSIDDYIGLDCEVRGKKDNENKNDTIVLGCQDEKSDKISSHISVCLKNNATQSDRPDHTKDDNPAKSIGKEKKDFNRPQSLMVNQSVKVNDIQQQKTAPNKILSVGTAQSKPGLSNDKCISSHTLDSKNTSKTAARKSLKVVRSQIGGQTKETTHNVFTSSGSDQHKSAVKTPQTENPTASNPPSSNNNNSLLVDNI